jgi:hypothetical protein
LMAGDGLLAFRLENRGEVVVAGHGERWVPSEPVHRVPVGTRGGRSR